ncbi:MAG TPA: glycosyltransferase family 4 protein [Candidatus Eisenbacteria bacterium]|jgi:sugar transferase (PEP-CTERM/EpsH1 system associated)
MRILFLTSRVPHPPEGGDRFRVFHFLRTVAEAGHEVHLLTFDDRPRTRDEISPLTRLTARTEIVRLPRAVSSMRALAALPGTCPLQLAYYGSRRMGARAAETIASVRPDVVYTHLFRMAPYALESQPRHRARWILDLTDVISGGIARSLPFRRGMDRWIYARERPRIERYERAIASRFDECWVISAAEERLLRSLAPEARVSVIPNGLPPDPPKAGGPRDHARLLFLGFQEVFHNRDAARLLIREVFPRVRARFPGATLDIAGRGSERLRDWAAGDGVRVLGHVDDLAGTMAGAGIFVAPHRFAAGVQNKVVVALANGTPVVTTPAVREGLEPVPDGTLCVGRDADELADRTVELLRDPDRAARLGQRGREWARGRFTWKTTLHAFEAMSLKEAVARPREPLVAAAG